MTQFSQGIMADGAAILRDGKLMAVDRVVETLNRITELEGQVGNLAMLISRLARQLDPTNPKHEAVCKAAFEYLRKINRTPGILREET